MCVCVCCNKPTKASEFIDPFQQNYGHGNTVKIYTCHECKNHSHNSPGKSKSNVGYLAIGAGMIILLLMKMENAENMPLKLGILSVGLFFLILGIYNSIQSSKKAKQTENLEGHFGPLSVVSIYNREIILTSKNKSLIEEIIALNPEYNNELKSKEANDQSIV